MERGAGAKKSSQKSGYSRQESAEHRARGLFFSLQGARPVTHCPGGSASRCSDLLRRKAGALGAFRCRASAL